MSAIQSERPTPVPLKRNTPASGGQACQQPKNQKTSKRTTKDNKLTLLNPAHTGFFNNISLREKKGVKLTKVNSFICNRMIASRLQQIDINFQLIAFSPFSGCLRQYLTILYSKNGQVNNFQPKSLVPLTTTYALRLTPYASPLTPYDLLMPHKSPLTPYALPLTPISPTSLLNCCPNLHKYPRPSVVVISPFPGQAWRPLPWCLKIR